MYIVYVFSLGKLYDWVQTINQSALNSLQNLLSFLTAYKNQQKTILEKPKDVKFPLM